MLKYPQVFHGTSKHSKFSIIKVYDDITALERLRAELPSIHNVIQYEYQDRGAIFSLTLTAYNNDDDIILKLYFQ